MGKHNRLMIGLSERSNLWQFCQRSANGAENRRFWRSNFWTNVQKSTNDVEK